MPDNEKIQSGGVMKKLFRIQHMVAYLSFKQISIIAMMILIFLPNCAQSQIKSHEGAWNLVYMKNISSDKLNWKFPGEYTGSDVKIWTKDHFIFVGQFKHDTTIVDNYGGGTYTLNGNRYEETILYHARADWVGSTLKMLLEVKGDSLIQTWPVNDNWQIDKSNYSFEKYVRLE